MAKIDAVKKRIDEKLDAIIRRDIGNGEIYRALESVRDDVSELHLSACAGGELPPFDREGAATEEWMEDPQEAAEYTAAPQSTSTEAGPIVS